MDLKEAAQHCERAWAQYAEKANIRREPDSFFLLKLQEELGELTRSYVETQGSEATRKTPEELKRKIQGDCVSVIGNALVMALRFGVDIEAKILEKFPVK